MFNLLQHEIAGIIAQIVAIPFIIMSAQKWWLANQSKHWLKTSGKVLKGFEISLSGKLNFLYVYEINGITYQCNKPFYANSYKNLGGKKSWKLMEKYPEGKRIDVFYNPSNPKASTLEPGRKDGVITALTVVILLFILGFLYQHYPVLFLDLFSKIQNYTS